MTELHAFGSWPSTSDPEKPSATAVLRPPTAAAITGVPHACASIATRPKDSLWLGTQTKSEARYQSGRLSCEAGSTNLIESEIPHQFANSFNRCNSLIPEPEDPPMIKTNNFERKL